MYIKSYSGPQKRWCLHLGIIGTLAECQFIENKQVHVSVSNSARSVAAPLTFKKKKKRTLLKAYYESAVPEVGKDVTERVSLSALYSTSSCP